MNGTALELTVKPSEQEPMTPGPGHVGDPKRSEGSRSEPSRSEGDPTLRGTPSNLSPPIPDPEVPEKPTRRRYTAEFKIRILEAADACTGPGQIGALLRREGIYSSLLTNWRRERARGELDALTPKKRGPKPKRDPLAVEIEQLRKEHEKLRERLRKAELIIHVQKKVLRILEVPEPEVPELDDWREGKRS
jgi:transposase